jgi:asparagine synthase (glutamine-hydrolysing)
MCGIAGKYIRTSGSLSYDEVLTYTNTLTHRGPDSSGIFCEGSIGLGHRRLSIIDLSKHGHQPMTSENGNFVITYNGEIYNYLEIRKELEAIGYQFEGHSDTSVIINGFEAWGDQIFAKLNGIFAIAIWDIKNAMLTLTRDRLGVKPLYYFVNDHQINFGSEIKAIIEDKSIKRVLDWQSFHEFLYYGNALGQNTMFRNIRKLKPGSILKIGKNDVNLSSFHEYKYDAQNDLHPVSEDQAIKETKNLLEQAVKRQLVGDVPVGVFLSGGIDSSAITAFATKHYDKKVLSYSAGFDFDDGHNELPLASKVASKFKTDHTEIMIQGKDIIGLIEKLVFHHDEPFSDAANIPLYLMTNEVKDKCKVVLQGDGGDELFAGYPRYHILSKIHRYKYFLSVANIIKPFIPFEKLRNKVNRFDFPFDLSYKMYARLLTPEIHPLNFINENIQKDLLKKNPFQRYEELCLQFENILDPVQKLLWIDTQVILQDQFL